MLFYDASIATPAEHRCDAPFIGSATIELWSAGASLKSFLKTSILKWIDPPVN
jgi:hypothetical protein